MFDTASEMVPLALAYLGLPPDLTAPGEKMAALFEGVRPYVRYFNAVQYSTDRSSRRRCAGRARTGH